MKEQVKRAKTISKKLLSLDREVKDKIFDELIENLDKRRVEIIDQNKIDLKLAKDNDLSSAMVDRLELNDERINQMIDGVRAIKEQPDVVGSFFDEFENKEGLKIKKQRVPLGVILMIFESRPNVVIDSAALAIKSSNSIILKGGKEATYSNKVLGDIIEESIRKYISPDMVIVLDSNDRSQIENLLKLNEYIDVVIPRGGHGLINYVSENAKMPVIAHFKGLCHMYVDKSANIDKAINLIENAKTQRPGVCNAIETLIVHKDVLPKIASKLVNNLKEKGTELRVDNSFNLESPESLSIATDKDWETEYLENILSVKTVNNIDDAIEHISKFGSNHSECIISEDDDACLKFLNNVDASCVMVNASTRFNDGGQLGLGAEIGISTTKIHAYGPMGAEQMTTARYVVVGDGHVRK